MSPGVRDGDEKWNFRHLERSIQEELAQYNNCLEANVVLQLKTMSVIRFTRFKLTKDIIPNGFW